LRERESVYKQGERQRQREKQTPLRKASPISSFSPMLKVLSSFLSSQIVTTVFSLTQTRQIILRMEKPVPQPQIKQL